MAVIAFMKRKNNNGFTLRSPSERVMKNRENLHETFSTNVLNSKTTNTIYDLAAIGKIPNAKTFKITGLTGFDTRLQKYDE